jgi:hypothetical protein
MGQACNSLCDRERLGGAEAPLVHLEKSRDPGKLFAMLGAPETTPDECPNFE